MPFIPSWIHPTDVVGSASAGANVGLAARARDLQQAAQQQAAQEFISKLNQQASQFAAEQELAQAKLASEHEIASSRLAQALRAQDALDLYRMGELDVRNRAADTNAAKLLKESMGFEPKDVTTPGGTKLVQTGKNSFQVLREPFTPQEVQIGDDTYIQTSPNQFHKKTTPKGRTPAEWNSYVNQLQKQLETATSDEDKANLGLQLKTAQEKQRELMTPGLPRAVITPGIDVPWYKTGTSTPPVTNWVQQLQGTNAPAAIDVQSAVKPAVEEKVIVVKDGKRYRLPKSELDEAERSGYRLER